MSEMLFHINQLKKKNFFGKRWKDIDNVEEMLDYKGYYEDDFGWWFREHTSKLQEGSDNEEVKYTDASRWLHTHVHYFGLRNMYKLGFYEGGLGWWADCEDEESTNK